MTYSPDLAEWCADGSHEDRPPLLRPWANPDLAAVRPEVWDVFVRAIAAVADEEGGWVA